MPFLCNNLHRIVQLPFLTKNNNYTNIRLFDIYLVPRIYFYTCQYKNLFSPLQLTHIMRGATRVKRRLTHTALISTHAPHERSNAKMATFISHKNEAYGIVLNTKGNTHRTQIIISPYNMIIGVFNLH